MRQRSDFFFLFTFFPLSHPSNRYLNWYHEQPTHKSTVYMQTPVRRWTDDKTVWETQKVEWRKVRDTWGVQCGDPYKLRGENNWILSPDVNAWLTHCMITPSICYASSDDWVLLNNNARCTIPTRCMRALIEMKLLVGGESRRANPITTTHQNLPITESSAGPLNSADVNDGKMEESMKSGDTKDVKREDATEEVTPKPLGKVTINCFACQEPMVLTGVEPFETCASCGESVQFCTTCGDVSTIGTQCNCSVTMLFDS